MLAYSSIAHGGYLLVALVAGNDIGKASILFYLLVYAITNLGAFAIIALLGSRENAARVTSTTTRASGTRSPVMAGLLTIFLLSLGGFPPMAGFVAKWYVFSAAVAGRAVHPRHRRRPDERRLGVLLPARRRDDVHDRARRAPMPRPRRRARRSWRWRSRSPCCSTWACCRRASSTSPPARSGRSCNRCRSGRRPPRKKPGDSRNGASCRTSHALGWASSSRRRRA